MKPNVNALQGLYCTFFFLERRLESQSENVFALYNGYPNDFHILILWPFLSLFLGFCLRFKPVHGTMVLLQGTNGQVFLGLPDLTIGQNPHAHCANHENPYLMGHAQYRPLCLFHRRFGKLWPPKFLRGTLPATMVCIRHAP